MGWRQQKFLRNQQTRSGWLFSVCRVVLLGVLALGLSGCMEYDVGIRFNSQTAGAIVQEIHLNRLMTVGAVTFEDWFESLEQETRNLKGFSRRRSPQDLELTLPFVNGADLVQKFNQLFDRSQPPQVSSSNSSNSSNNAASNGTTGVFPLTARIDLTQQNALLAIRNHLDLQVDLTRLGMITPEGDRLLDTDPLLQLNFYLETPWGVQWRTTSTASTSTGLTATGLTSTGLTSTGLTATGSTFTGSIGATHTQGNRASYPLRSGEINHITATFWIPSPVGLGALGILLLVTIGQRLLPKNDYV